jgi:hypothetical protein
MTPSVGVNYIKDIRSSQVEGKRRKMESIIKALKYA